MKQRHSYTHLLFHVVMRTKQREPFISGEKEGRLLEQSMKKKANELDAWLEEFGYFQDHVHLLLRIRPTYRLSDVYGQLKGFSSWAWRKHWPEQPFAWSDGVYAISVDPDNCENLRFYIRNQGNHHLEKTMIDTWEGQDLPNEPIRNL